MTTADRPIVFAYDGSQQAQQAIHEAARQLETGRPALVLNVWQPLAALPFASPDGAAAEIDSSMEQDALNVAGEGASLARSLGFDARPLTMSGVPVWSAIVQAADEHDSSLIVLGSHGRTGLGLALKGSVAGAVMHHTDRPVLVVHSAPVSDAA